MNLSGTIMPNRPALKIPRRPLLDGITAGVALAPRPGSVPFVVPAGRASVGL